MKVLPRVAAEKLWEKYWLEMQSEWFKLEVLQDYSGEDDGPSLRAWIAGNRQESLRLLEREAVAWRERCKQKSEQGVLLQRVRIVQEPSTTYTDWEFEFYKRANIPGGEQIFLVSQEDMRDLDVPVGDVMLFDRDRAVACEYENGRVIRRKFYERGEDITKLLTLQHKVLSLARPM